MTDPMIGGTAKTQLLEGTIDSSAVFVTTQAYSDVFTSPFEPSTDTNLDGHSNGSSNGSCNWSSNGHSNGLANLDHRSGEVNEDAKGHAIARIRRQDRILEVRQCGPQVVFVEKDASPLCQLAKGGTPNGLLAWYKDLLRDPSEPQSAVERALRPEDTKYDGIFIGDGDGDGEVAREVEGVYHQVLEAESATNLGKDGLVELPSNADRSLALMEAVATCTCGTDVSHIVTVADLAVAITEGECEGLKIDNSGTLYFRSTCTACHALHKESSPYVAAKCVGIGLSNSLRLVHLVREERRRALHLRRWVPAKDGIQVSPKQFSRSPVAGVSLTPQERQLIEQTGDSKITTKNKAALGSITEEEALWREQCEKLSFEYAVYTIVLAVSVAAPIATEAVQTLKAYAKPIIRMHWRWKLKDVPEAWAKAMSEEYGCDACGDGECIICGRVHCDDPTDLATHIARSDLYCRGHTWVDQGAQTWIYRLMSTAAFWDALSSKGKQGVLNARMCLRRLIADTALLGGEGAAETAVKLKCLYNVSTYISRRRMTEVLHREGPLYGRIPLHSGIDVRSVIACRAYEGMTGPYANDMAVRNACSRCAPWIMFMGVLGVVAHDGLDLFNDVLSGEPMNIYRHVAGLGAEALLAFSEGCQSILGMMCSAHVLDQLCCADVVCTALSGSISWYFVTIRYQTMTNAAIVCAQTQRLPQTAAGLALALDLLKAPSEVCEILSKTPLTVASTPVPRSKWGCYRRGGYRPSVEDGHWVHHEKLKHACVNSNSTTDAALDALNEETLAAHLRLGRTGLTRCGRGKHGTDCVPCDMAWENVTLCSTTGLVDRHVQFTLDCGAIELASAVDN